MAKAFVHCDMNPKEYLTVAQYAAMNHYSDDAVRAKIKKGYLKAIKVKGAWYIPKDATRAGTGKKQQPERIYQDGHYWLLTEAYAKKYQCSMFRIDYLLHRKRLPIMIWQGRRYIREDFVVEGNRYKRNVRLQRGQNNNLIMA